MGCLLMMLNSFYRLMFGVCLVVSYSPQLYAGEVTEELRSIYVSVNPPVRGFGVLSNDGKGEIFYDEAVRPGEVSTRQATDFHFFRFDDPEGFQFAFPADKVNGIDQWMFRDCTYVVIDQSFDVYEGGREKETKTTQFLIQSDCAFSRVRSHFLYSRANGLRAFTLSRHSKNGQMEPYDSFILGTEIGFGTESVFNNE